MQTSTTILEVINGQKLTPEDVIKAHGYDPKHWEITKNISNFWKQKEDVTSYQSKISIKPRSHIPVDELSKILNEQIKPITIRAENDGKHNLVIPLYDMHFGWATYNNMVAYLTQIEEIISHGYNEVHIIVGGDYFHSDFVDKTMTASGTQLDHVDNLAALKDGTRFFSELLESAMAHSNKVEIHGIPGNHDPDKQYMWLFGMQYKYPDVQFSNSERARDTFSFGKIGVMIAHGNLALKRLPMLFATEYPKMWANSKYRIIFSGHFHQQKLTDENGVVIFQCGTAKPKDNYEDKNGFDLSRKKMQVLEFSNTKLKATYEIEKE